MRLRCSNSQIHLDFEAGCVYASNFDEASRNDSEIEPDFSKNRPIHRRRCTIEKKTADFPYEIFPKGFELSSYRQYMRL